jgi:DNA polymerase-3 subunit alpha
MKVLVKEGWTDRDTGKKGEPRCNLLRSNNYRMYWKLFARKLVVL